MQSPFSKLRKIKKITSISYKNQIVHIFVNTHLNENCVNTHIAYHWGTFLWKRLSLRFHTQIFVYISINLKPLLSTYFLSILGFRCQIALSIININHISYHTLEKKYILSHKRLLKKTTFISYQNYIILEKSFISQKKGI